MTDTKNDWKTLIITSLSSDDDDARLFALDFLSNQNSFSVDILAEFMPLLESSLVHRDTRIRYFARRARSHIFDCFPSLNIDKTTGPVRVSDYKPVIKEGEQITAQQILLHKMYLKSRYVVFDAIERLTESSDLSLVEPMLKFLAEEKDEYKLSFLVRRLGRFKDKRIPEALVPFLDHEDSRVVANALDAFAEFDYPMIQSRLLDLAMSSDNRIRANAIKVLYRYSPSISEHHIAEMIKSKNIALQDSGVFLLNCLRPSNLGQLLEIACNSSYSSVRLKAIQIKPPSEAEKQNSEMLLKEDVEKIDPKRDAVFLICVLVVAAILLAFETEANKHLLIILFMGIGALIMLRPDTTRTSIQKSALSMGFLASMVWGSTYLMIIPGLMGLWLTWNEGRINKRGNPEKAAPENITAWFFVMGSIIISQLVLGDRSVLLRISGKFALLCDPALLKEIAPVIATQYHFDFILFVFVSGMAIGIVRFKSWFPLKRDENGNIIESIAQKKLMLITAVFLVLITFLCSVHYVTGLMRASVLRSKPPIEILTTVINGCKDKL